MAEKRDRSRLARIPEDARGITARPGVEAGARSAEAAPADGDPHQLRRFLEAQDSGGTFQRALEELGRGRKETHWMWFVFPQLAGLGSSPTSRQYAIASLEAARAYLRDPELGSRLHRCAELLDSASAGSAQRILGALDAQKLRSSMTLFLRAAPEDHLFQAVLDRHFHGLPDPLTDRLLEEGRGGSERT